MFNTEPSCRWIRNVCAAFFLTIATSTVALELQFVTASSENLNEPHDIVLSPDGRLLYVADSGNDRVVVLDAMSLAEKSVFAQGEVDAPHDVVFDARGRLLVADTGNARIAIYAMEANTGVGTLVDELKGKIRGPEGVAVHRDGRVFATGAWSHNLVVFDDGKIVAEVDGFSSPHDVEFGPDDEIWIADAANDRMVRLSAKLEVTQVLSGPDFNFRGPRYLDFDSAGRMFVADKYSNQVKVVGRNGELILTLGEVTKGKGPGLFDRPEGVEVNAQDVWFSDTYNNRIVRYRIVD